MPLVFGVRGGAAAVGLFTRLLSILVMIKPGGTRASLLGFLFFAAGPDGKLWPELFRAENDTGLFCCSRSREVPPAA